MKSKRQVGRPEIPGERLGPLRVGFFYGGIAALVSAFAHFFFFLLDPVETADWVLAATTDFLPLAALAAYLFLGILAASRARPTYLDSGVPYRSLLLRDAALAAVIVAVMAGVAGFIFTALQATVFADYIRNFASEAAPRIAAYVNEAGRDLSDPPPPTNANQVEALLSPPGLRDLGRALGNTASGAIFLGVVGAIIGAIRGRATSPETTDKPPETKPT